jgi:hypothetical protein
MRTRITVLGLPILAVDRHARVGLGDSTLAVNHRATAGLPSLAAGRHAPVGAPDSGAKSSRPDGAATTMVRDCG